MTTTEFSNQFDVLYNNIMSNQAPGLDEYEKSVFLTKAQDEIVKSYFNPKTNKTFDGFDGNERRQIDFSMLIKTISETKLTGISDAFLSEAANAAYYKMPSDILLYINEAVNATRKGSTVRLTVIPIDYNEFNRLMSKPLKRPLKNQAWRLIHTGGAISLTYNDYEGLAAAIASILNVEASTVYNSINGGLIEKDITKIKVNSTFYIKSDGTLTEVSSEAATAFADLDLTDYIGKTISASDPYVEMIPGPNDTLGSYIIRYVCRPNPIILTDLTSSNLTINGQSAEMTSRLDPILHEEILQRAVELAKAAYTGDLSSQIALGANSETEKGIIANTK